MTFRQNGIIKPKQKRYRLYTGQCACLMGWSLAILLVSLLVGNHHHHHVCAQQGMHGAEASCAPPSTDTYDWEKYDYYQVLGLLPQPDGEQLLEHDNNKSRKARRKERSKFKSADVRKAYRKQAQLYHPDKLASKKATEGGQNHTTAMTKEESTARFARIAEAYEVLNDENKRYEYDELLLDCEDQLWMKKEAPHQHQQQQQQQYGYAAGNPWSFFDDLTTDPWHVFEDFFFGDSFHEATQAEDTIMWDHDEASRHTKSAAPRRVYEREEFHYDPYRGAEVLRVLRTEEFDVDPQSQAYYYRVIAQDFVEQNDPFHGWEYHSINQPFVVDEGFRKEQEYSSSSSGTSFDNEPRQFQDRLLSGEALYPSSEPLLTSPNGRYYAGISAECEILIMSDSSRLGPNVDDKIVWSSETFVPAAQLMNAGGCFLSLQGPRLVLALGNPEHPGSILWYSEVSRTEEAMAQSDPNSNFVARLDNDGSLAVYSQKTASFDSEEDFSETRRFQWLAKMAAKLEDYPWWKNFVEKADVAPRTRAAKAWVACRSWVGRTVLGQKLRQKTWRSTTSNESSEAGMGSVETCIYATGVMGCNSSARKLLHVASDMKQSISHKLQHTMTRVDQAMDGFSDYLNEEVEEDEDVLDTLLRVLGAAGRGIGRAGRKAARHGASVVRDKMEEHRQKSKQAK